jgi:sec1 family domain-containing protein 1
LCLSGIFLKLTEGIKHTPQTLQQAQTNALLALLNLNSPGDSSATSVSLGKTQEGGLAIPNAAPPVWKILVLDQYTKDVLATVLRVQDLRDVGVTLHV